MVNLPLPVRVFLCLVKLLYWLGDGLAIWYKRLEEGTFTFPRSRSSSSGLSWSQAAGPHGLQIRAADLAMLLDGVDLASVKRQKRYQRPLSSGTV
jgi:transposase